MPNVSKHDCPDCRCNDKVLILPSGFLPPHLSFYGTSEGEWLVDEHNKTDEVWTKIWNDITKGFDRVEFRSME